MTDDMLVKEIFEYRPRLCTDRPLTFEELLEASGVERHSLRFIMADHGIRAEFRKGGKSFYSVADCNMVLRDPGFARNWHIEGFYNLRKGAELFGIPAHYIQTAIYKQEIPAKIRNFGRKGRTWVSWSSLEKLQQIYEQKQEARRTAAAKAKARKAAAEEFGQFSDSFGTLFGQFSDTFGQNSGERLDELFAAHPLVKDARCFRLSLWPESEPECFSSWEEA